MMTHIEASGRLDDFFDGALPPAEREAVMDHLEGCGECRAELERMALLQAETRALPRGIAPPRDLWPEIAARLAPRAAPAGEPEAKSVIAVDFQAARRRAPWTRWASMAAAAMVLVALSSGITAYLMSARAVAPVAVETAPAAPAERPITALAAFRPTEMEYIGTVETLQAELDARRDRLSPETLAVIEENLRIIDRAIAEARAALESDPANADLPLMLSGVYRQKVELLQTALQLPALQS